MIEFVLENRKLRLHPDGIMYVRAHNKLGQETKSGRCWKEVKFHKTTTGYMSCDITIDGRSIKFRQHRLVYYAHNQDWNIFNTSPDNLIDHINRKRDDNRIENLHVVTNQQNAFNTDAKGYSWNKNAGKWQSYIYLDGRKHYIGLFEKEEDAHNAYIKKKLELHLI
jgi:hypothetical protein